jgi:hypothetical protein
VTQRKFEIGEMAIAQHATFFTEFDGSLGIITQSLQSRLCRDLNTMKQYYSHVYQVKLLVKGEPHLWLRPWQLRKLGTCEKSKYKKMTQKSDHRKRLTTIV